MSERFLERIGILKHRVTREEADLANERMKQLTADYLTRAIELGEYKAELDKLPGIDIRRLAHDLNYKG